MRLFTLFVSTLFTAGGIWMIVDGDSTGWFVAGFFGFCLLVAVFEPWFPEPGQSDGVITFDSIGITLTRRTWRSEHPVVLRWDEIHTVTVFKRDQFSVDCICLFAARSDDSGLELDEEMSGWQGFVEAMPTYLPGSRKWEDWFLAIAFPAFATNPTHIYSRQSSCLPCP